MVAAGWPSVLTAIVPDGTTETETIMQAGDLPAFIAKHDGERNLYYARKPCKTPMSKKAGKRDVTAAEFAHADIDPEKNETPEQCKTEHSRR